MMAGVVSVSVRAGHGLGKDVRDAITLIEGEGVAGDAHCGQTVKHRSRVARDPNQPNLRQVHLIHAELLEELAERGFAVAPGALGENILTRGIDLLGLSQGVRLLFPSGAEIAITGLRNPCHQLNGHTPGLMDALLDRDADGALVRRSGIMAIVVRGGLVGSGDAVTLRRSAGPPLPLRPV
jgi:MOSC domain-containing protein YiiM